MGAAVEIQVYESGRRRPQYSIDSDLNGETTLQELLEWSKSSLIIIADQVLGEEQKIGFDKNPIVTVDGRVGAPISSVHPLGGIEFSSRADIKDILFDTYESLLNRSKVLTGAYKSSHLVFLNGTQVASNLRELEVWYAFSSPKFQDNDKIRFVNTQPYARRLERLGVTAQRTRASLRDPGGKKKPRGFTVKIPNGAYALTARAIRSKYKRNSSIVFTFISGGILGIPGSFKSGRKGKNSAGRPYLYPSIVISVNERGVT